MAKKNFMKKWIFALISLLFIVATVFGILPELRGNSANKQIGTANADDVSEEDYADLGEYAAFQHGATWSYTDHLKVADFVGQSDGNGTDVTTITVDRTYTHGTRQNPYVIDSYKLWEQFARDCSFYSHQSNESYSYGYGKVYVLASDIVFTNASGGQPFIPIETFGGEFYGLGHSLKNITYDFATRPVSWVTNHSSDWNTTGLGMGIFGNSFAGADLSRSATTVIADLNVDNFSFTHCGIYTGAIVGRMWTLTTIVMNCHTKGTFERTTGANNNAGWGGIAGAVDNGALPYIQDPKVTYVKYIWNEDFFVKNIYIYRCSSQTTMTIKEASTAVNLTYIVGGILGGSWFYGSSLVWDCYADTTLTTSGFAYGYGGGMVGAVPANGLKYSANNNNTITATYSYTHDVQRCVSNFKHNFAGWGTSADAVNSPVFIADSSVVSIMAQGDPDGTGTNQKRYQFANSNISVKDTYSVNALNYSLATGNAYDAAGGTKAVFYFPVLTGRYIHQATYQEFASITASNNSYAGSNAFGATTNNYQPAGTSVGSYIKYAGSEISNTGSSLNKIYTNAKNSTALMTKMWSNKDVLGTAFNIDNAPVKSKVVVPDFKVEFYNLKMSGSTLVDEPIAGLSALTYRYGEQSFLGLPTPEASSGRAFRGWTTDTSGNSAGIRSIDNMTGMNGNLKFYAIWNITDTSATLATQDGRTEVERGETITLIATVNAPSITKPNITYKFLKDGNVVATTMGTNNTYIISQVSQNGLYTLDYEVTDPEYPLVKATGHAEEQFNLEIARKSTTLKRFTQNTNTPAYLSAPLKAVEFTLVMEDNGKEVPGKAKWQYGDVPITAGTNKATIVFEPTDSNTYKPMIVEVEFESVPFTLTFAIPSIPGADFVVEIDYDQPISAQKIISMFEEEFAKKIDADSAFEASVNNRTPKLDGIDIDRYNKDITGATKPVTITVTFSEVREYVVNMYYGFDGKGEVIKAHWNQRILAPNIKRSDDWVLVGWYITEDDEVTDKKWDFDKDRVTKDIALTAKWDRNVLEFTGIEVTTPRDPFTATALTPLANLGITVKAVYMSSISGESKKTIPMQSAGVTDGYVIKVDGILGGDLHVTTTEIVIEYLDQSMTVPIKVTPVNLDIYRNQINFPTCTKDYTGNPLEIDPLYITSLPTAIQQWVVDIQLTYSKGGVPVEKSDVVSQGTYVVTATFELSSADHMLSPITTYFIISPPRVAVRVTWEVPPASGYTYDGTPHHPTATLVDANGVTLSAAQFEYVIINKTTLAKANGADAGSYRISVNFPNETIARTYKFEEGTVTTTEFTINKMKVAKPKPLGTSFEYTGSDITFMFDGLESYMTVSESGRSGLKVGSYTVTVTLDGNHEWTEGGSSATFSWSITKAKLERPSFYEITLEYSGFEYDLEERLEGFDPDKMVLTSAKATKAGSYTANIMPGENYTWENASTPVVISWTITKAKLLIDWDPEDTYEAGTRVNPKITRVIGLRGNDKFDAKADAEKVRYSGDTNKNTVGSYIVTISAFLTDWADNYEIDDVGKGYRIIPLGADRNDPNNPTVPDPENPNGGNGGSGNQGGNGGSGNQGGNQGGNGGGTTGDNPSGRTIDCLPQLILSGIGLVLLLVFTVMTLNYSAAAKQATAKAQKLAQVSYYSFAAPVALLALMGMSGTAWWAITGVLLALALIMGIVAFMFRGKKQRALAMLEEEQERVNMEREDAKEEKARMDQQRRDEEMRMMFAAMQQNAGQPQMNYEAIQGMISSTVTALLPAMQQFQALPSAAEQQPALPSYDSELRAQMAAQQEQIAAQQAQMAQMAAQQQEYFNQMMQQQKAQEDYMMQQSAQEAAMAAENARVEAVFNQIDPNAAPVTLEESYGKLSDEAKRFYYEIGRFIMERQHVIQNDGKYAVLFRYRGKTLFKLAIKNGAPTITYLMGGSPIDCSVSDNNTLEMAKQILAARIAETDREMGVN